MQYSQVNFVSKKMSRFRILGEQFKKIQTENEYE